MNGTRISTQAPSLADLVCRVGICVDVVRVDVEGHQSEGLEGGRVDDRHVVGCVDAHL